MFGTPQINLGFMNDPQKLALFATGLQMLATGDPSRAMAAFPSLMMAAAQAKAAQKERAMLLPLRQQEMQLRQEELKLRQQALKTQLESRKQLAQMLGIGGGSLTAPGGINPPPAGDMMQPVPQPSTQAPQQTTAQNALVAGMTPMQRYMFLNDPVYRRQYMIGRLKVRQPAAPKLQPFKTRSGQIVTVDMSTPEGQARARQIAASGAVPVKMTVNDKTSAGGPLEQVDLEGVKKEYAAFQKESAIVDTMANELPTILTSKGYQGVGEKLFANVVQTVRDTTGLFKDVDIQHVNAKELLHKKLVLDAAGGSLSRGISDRDMKLLREGLPNTGSSREDLAIIYMQRRAIADANSKYWAFIRRSMREGMPISEAKRRWREAIKWRDTHGMDGINPAVRPYIPEPITMKRIRAEARAYLDRLGARDRSLVDHAKDMRPEMERAMSGKQKAQNTIEAKTPDELFSKLKEMNPNLTREEFDRALRDGRIRLAQ